MVHGLLVPGFGLVLQSPVATTEPPCLIRVQVQAELLEELAPPKSQQRNKYPSNLEFPAFSHYGSGLRWGEICPFWRNNTEHYLPQPQKRNHEHEGRERCRGRRGLACSTERKVSKDLPALTDHT